MFATRVESRIFKALKHLSVDTEKNISDLVEEAIEDLLDKYEGRKREPRVIKKAEIRPIK